ncbi:MAG: hypothetical protein MJK04_36220 [Psychrosphaera sp.]|nr:hypothetical protein [Psychrosphaera sp.]
MTTNTIISVADYYGTKGARELVHRVKNNDVEAIAIMARAMAVVAIERLPAGSVLIPVPSHSGHATNTLQLAEQISLLTAFPVRDIVKGQEREPWYTLKHQGVMAVTAEYFGFYLVGNTSFHTLVLIDSVFDTGRTTNAILEQMHKQVITIVYAVVTGLP